MSDIWERERERKRERERERERERQRECEETEREEHKVPGTVVPWYLVQKNIINTELMTSV
jgi:hypothetical protein